MRNAASRSVVGREFRGFSAKTPYGGCHEGQLFFLAHCYDCPGLVFAVVFFFFK